MKIKNKQTKKIDKKSTSKTNVLKWVTFGLGIAIVAAWIGWFICDCLFISKGIDMSKGVIAWTWDEQWYHISNTYGAVVLAMLGGYIVLLLSYMVNCGLKAKKNIKFYAYQMLAMAVSFIGILICIVNAANMMVQEKYVIEINATLTSLTFNVYHLDYLKWISIAFGLTIFANVLIFTSFKKFDRHSIIRDCNSLIIVLAIASVIFFIPFVICLGWNDADIGGAGSISAWIELIQNKITWKHVVCQCVTSPMGVLAGMIMVLQVIRLITVVFVYNENWGQKKAHIIIFSIITFLVFAAFIVAHVNKLDFEKLLNDYQSMKLGCLLVVLAQTLTCLASGTYCSISHFNYGKRVRG